MNVPHGTDLRAALAVACLLESDLEFYNVLHPSEGNLTLYGGGRGPDDTPFGQMEVWWSVDIEARSWGIKDITVHVSKLVLDGWFEDENGRSTGELFRHEYPEKKEPLEIGANPDAATPDNVYRLAQPKWKVEWSLDSSKKSRTVFVPEAEVDLSRHTIEIKF